VKRGGPLQRYKALEAKTPMRRSGWIKRKPPTQKQRDDRAELEASKRIIWERSRGRCEFVNPTTSDLVGRCLIEAQDPHHISRQSQGPDHSPDNLLAVCRFHHRWIHDNVTEARALGYLSPAKRGEL
jgi:hypothetical protein